MHLFRSLLIASLGFLFLLPAGADASPPVKIALWGMQSTEETQGQNAAIAEFNRRHPNIRVSLLSMGGGMDPQKLMTAIAGGAPPDVIYQDRFTIGDWASRDAFMPLDDLLKADPGQIRQKDYYNACWQEAVYKGQLFAIPYGTDDRALYYNRTAFREVGLDPDRPPRTWSELEQMALRLTKKAPDGSFRRIGFIPNYGNSWLYLYAWQMNAEFMDPSGRKCTMNTPAAVKALDFMTHMYDAMGGTERVKAFEASFQTAELDPFFIGKVAMCTNGNWQLANIARFAPGLDFAVAPAPVPDDRYFRRHPFSAKDPQFVTWAGGFSLAIPRGVKHPKESWEFVKWMNSTDAWLIMSKAQKAYNEMKGRTYVPNLSASQRINNAVFAAYAPRSERLSKALRLFIDMMPAARFRPVTFVGQRLWDEHVRAFDLAIRHKATSEEALAEGQRVVQKELDKVFQRGQYPLLSPLVPLAVGLLAVLGLIAYIVFIVRKSGRIGQLMRAEAFAGYLFASPWLLGFLLFTLGPILASIVLSFCDYDVLHPARFVGLANFGQILSPAGDRPLVMRSITNVAFLSVVGIPLGMVTGLSIAMLLNAKTKGMSSYRTAYYLPSIVPVVASGILWIWLLNPEYGLINAAWRGSIGSWFGISAPTWLASEA
ncbi:MAG TPA: extracellular solute-binding protein, partial [Armatimonadota bacterium]